MRTTFKLIPLFLGLLIFTQCKNRDENVDTELALPVSVMNVKTGSIEKFVNATGTVNATQVAELKSEITGKYILQTNPLTGKPFHLGDKVKEGQLIIKIEDKEFENNLNMESKKLNLEVSKQEYQKQESLYKKGGVTLRELRNSEISYINAQNSYENVLLSMEKIEVRAPFSGIIVDLPYYTNHTKIPAGQLLVKLMNYNKMFMEINLPEKNMQILKTGQLARITNYVTPDDTLTGKITEISPALSTETRTFKLKIMIDNPELKLRPGMFVKSDIIIEKKDSVIVIPKKYILSRNNAKKIFVVEKSTAHERILETGLENNLNIEVIKGLEVNEKLVTKGFETLRDRSKVKVIK